jgi:cytochrome c peroxidase
MQPIASKLKATGSDPIDKGRAEATNDQADLYLFRVASLRNVAKTPPFFHDGSVATLLEAVKVMARVQLGGNPQRCRSARNRRISRRPYGRASGEFRNCPGASVGCCFVTEMTEGRRSHSCKASEPGAHSGSAAALITA